MGTNKRKYSQTPGPTGTGTYRFLQPFLPGIDQINAGISYGCDAIINLNIRHHAGGRLKALQPL